MYIHEFGVRNYAVHKNTAVRLSPITVFVGPNGGGKSAFFDALINFSMVARGNVRQAFGQYPFSFSATRFHPADKLSRIGFDVLMSRSLSQAQLRYRIDYAQQGAADLGNPKFQIFNENLRDVSADRVLFDRNDIDSSPLKAAMPFLENDRGVFAAVRSALVAGANFDDYSQVEECAKQVSRLNKFRLNPFTLASFSRLPDATSNEGAPRIGHEGEDLAGCLYFMSETKDPALETIVEKVKALIPEFEKFEFNTIGADRVGFSVVFNDGRGSIPAVKVSHGMLLFLGLMVLTCSPNRPPVMLIEEPENGLTPIALRQFYRAIRDLAFRPDEMQRSQVLISSHSPFVICEAWNGEDREFIHQMKVVNGQAAVRKFSDVIAQEGATLGKDELGKRTVLGLRTAELLMAGYLS
jgi:predicted ATPase